jgi:hypothetical protein
MPDDVDQQFGLLAAEFGGRRLPLQVCRSAAGFYLGTREENGELFTRESKESWPTRQEAERALMSRDWTQRPHVMTERSWLILSLTRR